MRKRLWAPWRIKYILESKTQGCFLCDIVKRRADTANLVVRRGRACILLLNRYPYNGGHLMVAPLRHIAELQALNAAEQLELMQLTALGMDLLGKVCHPDGYNIGVNQGEAAGAGLKDHIHLHIVPRWNGDTNFMPVIADIKVIPQSLEELRAALAAAGKKHTKQSPRR